MSLTPFRFNKILRKFFVSKSASDGGYISGSYTIAPQNRKYSRANSNKGRSLAAKNGAGSNDSKSEYDPASKNPTADTNSTLFETRAQFLLNNPNISIPGKNIEDLNTTNKHVLDGSTLVGGKKDGNQVVIVKSTKSSQTNDLSNTKKKYTHKNEAYPVDNQVEFQQQAVDILNTNSSQVVYANRFKAALLSLFPKISGSINAALSDRNATTPYSQDTEKLEFLNFIDSFYRSKNINNLGGEKSSDGYTSILKFLNLKLFYIDQSKISDALGYSEPLLLHLFLMQYKGLPKLSAIVFKPSDDVSNQFGELEHDTNLLEAFIK
ncbi:hypothetical protein AX774_g3592 [Zancudomyces culisetae]|uniref:Uncharacterized protein n=1 Tax=Zancudomyces culisetae TaxID=1213189 RepID=A0A1R1PPK1_ZANCU|nr:hypothetical protein AX774_g3592 [Zancudomyces culisetae]|eukprot:OMH82916.1 hypothetical protein AX774_g3592 [Zancudomyces culisetae]